MTDLNFARTRLESALNAGRVSAGAVIRNVLETQPADEIIPAKGVTVTVQHGAFAHRVVTTGRGRRTTGPQVTTPSALRVWTPEAADATITDFATGQLFEKLGIDRGYACGLLTEDPMHPWRGELLQHTLNTHLQNAPDRFLVRRIGNQTRGILSDKFKRIDCRPMLDSFIGAARALGAEPISGHATETRVAVRAVIPQIYEPVPGEAMVFGLHWGNSDFGNGLYHVTAFILRLVCLNGMTGEKMLKAAHIGGRLHDDIEYSNRTRELTEQAMVSQTKDVVRAALGPEAIEGHLARIRAAHSEEVDFKTAWARVSKQLTKADRDAAESVYNSPDVVNVPAGKTMWRFANALSWVANSEDVPEERKLDLQKEAGKLMGIA